MELQITNQFIRSIGKETLQATEESIRLPTLYLTNKFLYLKRSFRFVYPGINGIKNLINPSSTSLFGKPKL